MLSKTYKSIFVLLSFVITASAAVAQEADFETASDLNAADILPGEILQGEHHTVDSRVRNDGYLNYYTIQSDFGEFEAVGNPMLQTRIGEINALAQLDELSKTEVFAKAALDAGVKQLRTVQDFATRPVETVKGIPKGIGNMFRRYSRKAGDAVDATKEFVAGNDENAGQEAQETESDEDDGSNAAVELTESYMGVDKAQRNWARKLGTDPYSSNTVLKAAIKEVAWAERLGKFGMGFAGVPEIPGADIIGDVNEAVWGKDPYELRDLNHARLAATGADEALIEQYLDNSQMTPSQLTLLTAAIAELEGVSGRDGILRQSLNPESEAEAEFFIKSLTTLAWYHRNQNPVASVTTDNAIPAAHLGNGTIVVAFAVDHVNWTETVAQAAELFAEPREQKREVWLLGSASERTIAELDNFGFDVHVGVAAMLAENTD